LTRKTGKKYFLTKSLTEFAIKNPECQINYHESRIKYIEILISLIKISKGQDLNTFFFLLSSLINAIFAALKHKI